MEKRSGVWKYFKVTNSNEAKAQLLSSLTSDNSVGYSYLYSATEKAEYWNK